MVLVHCTSAFLNEIYLPMKFQVSSLKTFRVMLRTKFKIENEQRAIANNSKSMKLCVIVLVHCTSLK